MTEIKKEIQFKAPEAIDLRKKTTEYFFKSGFKQFGGKENDTKLIFGRGSLSSNMWTFNPLNWKSEIYIEINEQEIKAKFYINAAGQLITKKEEQLWETFILNYQKSILDSDFDFLEENRKSLKSTREKSLKYVAWAALGGIVAGLPAGLIAYYTEISDSIVPVAAAAGAIAALTKKVNDEKK